jgi:uncharacterized membrane protein
MDARALLTSALLTSALVVTGTAAGVTLALAQAPTLTEAQIKAGFTPQNIGHSVPAPTAYKAEKCYGIAKAGLNDCAARGVHSCSAGAFSMDFLIENWIETGHVWRRGEAIAREHDAGVRPITTANTGPRTP